MKAISAHHLYKIFGRRPREGVAQLEKGATPDQVKARGLTPAVIDASFDVEEGEIFVVMGLSGSGKSTLLRMVNGLHEPTAGHVEIYGENLTAMKANDLRQARRDKVSMVFQHFALFPHRTVLDNAAYGLETKGVSKKERRERAHEALELSGLVGWDHHLPDQLSGGMQQRVGLARALAADTPILLMDEAFSALDPLIRRDMQDQLIELQAKLDKTILFITHDLNEAMRLGDRIAMMRDGRIEQIGTSEEILTEPANDYVAKFTQDVDRTRVLTAGTIMEAPVAVVGSEQGPRVAHRLMRENQLKEIFVVDRQRRLRGLLTEAVVADAVTRRITDVTSILNPNPANVTSETIIADILTDSAMTGAPLAVIDDRQRLVGTIAHVTLLNAMAHTSFEEPIEESSANSVLEDLASIEAGA